MNSVAQHFSKDSRAEELIMLRKSVVSGKQRLGEKQREALEQWIKERQRDLPEDKAKKNRRPGR